VRGIENVHQKLLLQAAACNLALLMRSLYGAGKPRAAHDHIGKAVFAMLACIKATAALWQPRPVNSACPTQKGRTSPNSHLLCRVTENRAV
jgi:hypothetical protein